MHASYCYHNSYQEAVLVHDDMTLNAFAVNAIERTVIALAYTLTVHNANARFGFLTLPDTDFLTPVVHHPWKNICSNSNKPVPKGKMEGEHAPLATRLYKIENGIPYLTQIIFSLSFLQVQDFLDNLSL